MTEMRLFPDSTCVFDSLGRLLTGQLEGGGLVRYRLSEEDFPLWLVEVKFKHELPDRVKSWRREIESEEEEAYIPIELIRKKISKWMGKLPPWVREQLCGNLDEALSKLLKELRKDEVEVFPVDRLLDFILSHMSEKNPYGYYFLQSVKVIRFSGSHEERVSLADLPHRAREWLKQTYDI